MTIHAHQTDPGKRSGGARRPRLLVMEADAERRRPLAQWLDEAGFDCVEADGLADSLPKLGQHSFDLVLANVDQVDEVQAGWISALRKVAARDDLPILAFGEKLDPAARAELIEGGLDEAISVAQPDPELLARLGALLRQQELRRKLSAEGAQYRKRLAAQRKLLRRLRRRAQRLRDMAITDPMTGAYNGRYFRQWLTTQFEIARRYKLVISVLVLDIDHFKRVNDSCGHPFGDYVLSKFAEILAAQVRSSDVVARCGGDEFVIGLVETSRQESIRFGRRLLRAVAAHSFEYFGQAESITVSIGQAGFPEDGEVRSAEQLLLFADRALYRAKANGRNDLACWHELESGTRARLATQMHKSEVPEMSAAPSLHFEDAET